MSFQWEHEVRFGEQTVLFLSHQFPLDTQAFAYREARLDPRVLRIADPSKPIATLVLEESTAQGIMRIRSREPDQTFQIKFSVDLNQNGRIEPHEETTLQRTAQGKELEVATPPFRTRVRETLFHVEVRDHNGEPLGWAGGTWVFGVGQYESHSRNATIEPRWEFLTLLGVRFETRTGNTVFPLPNPFQKVKFSTGDAELNSVELLSQISSESQGVQ